MKHFILFLFVTLSVLGFAQTVIPPQNVALHFDSASAILTFDPVPGATGYRIEQSRNIDSGFTTVGYAFTNNYQLRNYNVNTAQFYRVVSIGPVDQSQVVLQPETVVVGSEFQAAVLFMTDNYIVLDRFRVLLMDFYVNEIIVSGPFSLASQGFVRKISEVESHDNYVVLRTEQAAIEEVFDVAEIQSIEQLSFDNIATTEYYYRGISCTRSSDTDRPVSISYPFNNVSVGFITGGSVTLDGELDFDYDFLLDIDVNSISHSREVQFQMGARGGGVLSYSSSSLGGFSGRVNLLKHTFNPITYYIGIVPICIVPEITLKLKVSSTGATEYTTLVEEDFDYTIGLTYMNSQWNTYHNGNNHFQVNTSEVCESSVSLGIGPEFILKLYNVAGPYVEAIGSLETVTNLNEDPWQVGLAKIDAGIGLRMKALFLDIDSGTFDVNIYNETMFERHKVKQPIISPQGGEFNNAQLISITCETPNTDIRYTTDGSEPNTSSSLYSNPIIVDNPTAITARGFRSNYTPSDTTRADFNFRCANPSINPEGGSYTGSVLITINCETENAQIRYTLDGSEPNESSQLYTAPFIISSSCTVMTRAYKESWTQSLIASTQFDVTLLASDFVLVLGGTFNNGVSDVTVSSFYIDRYEITQSTYQYVTAINPVVGQGYAIGPDYPIYNVSWFDAIKYCNQRSVMEGLTPCYSYGTYGTSVSSWPLNWEDNYSDPNTGLAVNFQASGYRLPTVNEWRFAAKGGNLTPSSNYPAYSGSNNIDEVAWYHPNSGNTMHIVGTKAPNALGLYDMSGNIWEWCWEICWNWRYVQGGAWDCNYYHCLITHDDQCLESEHESTIGFRICRTAINQ